ncbi:hypothetical protein FDZ71_04580, partial [bacterium]
MTRSHSRRHFDALVVAATRGELSWVSDVEVLKDMTIGGARTLFVVSGPGVANVSYMLGKVLAVARPSLILCVGIGGAYRSSGLVEGDVAVATAEYDADWGVETPSPEDRGRLSVPRLIHEGSEFHESFP